MGSIHPWEAFETCQTFYQHTCDISMMTICTCIIMLIAHGHTITDTFNWLNVPKGSVHNKPISVRNLSFAFWSILQPLLPAPCSFPLSSNASAHPSNLDGTVAVPGFSAGGAGAGIPNISPSRVNFMKPPRPIYSPGAAVRPAHLVAGVRGSPPRTLSRRVARRCVRG